MADRILVWGAGAIGGTAGAFLKRAGNDVSFVDIVPEHVAAIAGPGLAITGPVDAFSVSAPAFTLDTLAGTWDHIYLAVKAQFTEAAARALLPHLTPGGYVLSLQNGLCEEIIASVVGPQRVIGAFINYGADWIAPGEILFGNRGACVLGELDGRTTPRLDALHATIRDGFEPGSHRHRPDPVLPLGQTRLPDAALRPGTRSTRYRRLPCPSRNCCRCGGQSAPRCMR